MFSIENCLSIGLLASLTNGLASNLIAEGIGILVTVFIVDYLIKSNEKRRWETARRVLSIRMGFFAHSLIYNVVVCIAKARAESPAASLKEVPLTPQNLCRYITNEGNKIRSFDMSVLQQFKDTLTSMLPVVPMAQDPEVIKDTLMLDRVLEVVLMFKTYDLNNNASRLEFLGQLQIIVAYAAYLAQKSALHGDQRILVFPIFAEIPFKMSNDKNKLDIDGKDTFPVPSDTGALYEPAEEPNS